MTAAVSSLVYTLVQFQRIGDGLYAINACYLPISDETTKLDLIVFQLQREQDRLDLQASDPVLEFLNAEFYIRDLREGLDRTATSHILALVGAHYEDDGCQVDSKSGRVGT